MYAHEADEWRHETRRMTEWDRHTTAQTIRTSNSQSPADTDLTLAEAMGENR